MVKPLRVVGEEDSSPVSVAARGSRRELLVALRDNISGAIDEGVPARDLASLSLRLVKIAGELEELDAAAKETRVAVAAATPDEKF